MSDVNSCGIEDVELILLLIREHEIQLYWPTENLDPCWQKFVKLLCRFSICCTAYILIFYVSQTLHNFVEFFLWLLRPKTILLRLFSKIAPQFATFCTLCIKIASYQWRVIFNHFVCTVITQVTRTRNVTIGWNHKRSVDLVISCEKDKIANCRRFLEFALIIVLTKSQFPGGTGFYSLKCFPAQCWGLYCWPMRQRHKLPTCLDF